MKTKQTDTLCRGVELGNRAGSLAGFSETVMRKADLLHEVNGEDQENSKNVVVTARQETECETLKRLPLVVKVPIEYLNENGLTVFEVPIHPWSRQADVMSALKGRVPHLDALELWCWPRSQALCRDAHVYELAVVGRQHFLLRPRPSLVERIRHQVHDRGVLNLTRPCSCL